MSVEATCKTLINDRDALCDAIKEIYGEGSVEIAESGVEAKGYRTKIKPTILIKLKNMYGTAGFYRTPEGLYSLVYDSTDRSRISKLLPQTNKKTGVVTDVLTQTYTKMKVVKSMKAMRGRIMKNEIEADGTIRIKARISHY